jgi:hypothetical protein
MMMKKIVRLNRLGQATTELAVLGAILLIILASLLKYGQIMARQQELQMSTFRRALSKIDQAYDAGIGRVTYSTIEDSRLVDVFSKHYDGNQRLRLSASSSVFWDNDVYAIDGAADGKFFYSINEEEMELPGGSATVEDVETIPFVQTHGATDVIQFDGSGASSYSRQGSATETVTTTLKMGDGGEDRVITQTREFTEDSTWFTPGE